MHYGYHKYPTYTSFTSYINSDNLDDIVRVITNLLTCEKDCYSLPSLPYLIIDINKLGRRYMNERPPLIMVALASGKNGWAIVRTYPNEWLFLRANGVRPRLSDISMELKCNAFYYQVIHDSGNLLMEIDPEGNFRFDYIMFPQFSLIDISNVFVEIMNIAQENSVGSYFSGNKCSGELITTALAKLINHSQDRWDNNDLYYTVYDNVQWLEQMNIKLLYFLPSDNYLSTLPRYNDEPDEYYDLLSGHWHESPF